MKTFRKLSQELEERDYKREYANYHSRPDQIERRSARNSARRIVKSKTKNEEDIAGKDVHHKDNNPLNNDEKNLSVVSQRYNSCLLYTSPSQRDLSTARLTSSA